MYQYWIYLENKVKVLRSPFRLGFSYLGNDRLADNDDLFLEKGVSMNMKTAVLIALIGTSLGVLLSILQNNRHFLLLKQ